MIVFFSLPTLHTTSIVLFISSNWLKLNTVKPSNRLWIHTNLPFSFSFSHQNYNYFSSLLLPDDHEMYFLSYICWPFFPISSHISVLCVLKRRARVQLVWFAKSQESYCTNFYFVFCISAKFNELLCGIGISNAKKNPESSHRQYIHTHHFSVCFHIAFHMKTAGWTNQQQQQQWKKKLWCTFME